MAPEAPEAPEAPGEDRLRERLSLYPSVVTAERIRRVAAFRKTSTAASGLWLLEHALDWYERLLPDDRETR